MGDERGSRPTASPKDAIHSLGNAYTSHISSGDHELGMLNNMWKQARTRFPQHGDAIDAIREMLEKIKLAEELEEQIHNGAGITRELMGKPFVNMPDLPAARLLTDILWGRSISAGMSIGLQPEGLAAQQFENDLDECGIHQGSTYKEVLQAILDRKLKLHA